MKKIATPCIVKATLSSVESPEVAATTVPVMVAGPTCTKNLATPKPEGVTLILGDPYPTSDDSDFAKLHLQFKPGGGGCQLRPKPSCRRSSLNIFFVTCTCTCNRPLKLAVQSSKDKIRDFQQLLTEPTFDLLCPTCGNRYYYGR